MQWAESLLDRIGLQPTEGQPLYQYAISPDAFAELERALASHIAVGGRPDVAAPPFVFWAAEHVRARFQGGPLTWAFVLEPLGLPPEDQTAGRRLTESGLRWWGRSVRQTRAGINLYLYSLMAEGGIPEALLADAGLYRSVVMGVLSDIEAEGGSEAEPWTHSIAARWVERLPQTFRTEEIQQLVADLALALTKLRADLPADLPQAAAEAWLNRHRPGWVKKLPLRMTPAIAESLIRPALRATRRTPSEAAGSLCQRELRQDTDGNWHAYLVLADSGWLPAAHWPSAQGLRLLLVPTGARDLGAIRFIATPEVDGWQLGRVGPVTRATARWPPEKPFVLAAFSDGHEKGQAVVEPGLPTAIEAPGLWRAADPCEGAHATRLVPHAGRGRTRGTCLWLLGPHDIEPSADDGVRLEEVEQAPHGWLWRVSGAGEVRLGDRRFAIQTETDEESPDARLLAYGPPLPGWQLATAVPVHRGDVEFHGQIGEAPAARLPDRALRRTPGRTLCAEVVEWVREGEALAHCRLVCLPEAVGFALEETNPGEVTLTGTGIDPKWNVRLCAGIEEAGGIRTGTTVRLTLRISGRPPGVVRLRLSQPDIGHSIELEAPWPTRTGMVLDPDGQRLEHDRPLSVDALDGWRAVVPPGQFGDLQLRMIGYQPISIRVHGEASLASRESLVRAMLAQGDPDAQVNACVVVAGMESARLRIRRYEGVAGIADGVFHAGLARDAPNVPETTLAAESETLPTVTLHALDLGGGKVIGPIELPARVDLENHLSRSSGPWLIQSRLGGQTQRATFWNPQETAPSTREERIRDYAEQWERYETDAADPGLSQMWELIVAAGRGGDAGVLDQVQAIARVPAVLVLLALRVREPELALVFNLDTAAPILWPIMPVADFARAVKSQYRSMRSSLTPHIEAAAAEAAALQAIVGRLSKILIHRPEWCTHVGHALADAGLIGHVAADPSLAEVLGRVIVREPMDFLFRQAQVAARRFDRLPNGVGRLEPLHRPNRLSVFHRYCQSLIDAPLVAAEMAAGIRPPPDVDERLMLINLRLVDPDYFDAALPAALCHYMELP